MNNLLHQWDVIAILLRACKTLAVKDINVLCFYPASRIAACNVIDGMGILHLTKTHAEDAFPIVWTQLVQQQMRSPLLGISLRWHQNRDLVGKRAFQSISTKNMAQTVTTLLDGTAIFDKEYFETVQDMITALAATRAERSDIRDFPLLLAAMDITFSCANSADLLQETMTQLRNQVYEFDFQRLKLLESFGYQSSLTSTLKSLHAQSVPRAPSSNIMNVCNPILITAAIRQLHNPETPISPDLLDQMKLQVTYIRLIARDGLRKLGMGADNLHAKFGKIAHFTRTHENPELANEECLWFWVQYC